jgi:hypothetical protein
VVEAFRVKKVGVGDTTTEKAKAKVMVDGAREQELDLFGTSSAQAVREASSQVQEQASSYETNSYARTPVLMSRRKRPRGSLCPCPLERCSSFACQLD